MTDETFRLILDLGNSGKSASEVTAELAKLEQQSNKTGKAMDASEKGGDKLNKNLNHLSRGALQFSQASQDIAQGGLAAALNNVDGIVGSLAKGMGMSAASATALSAGLLGIGTAALVLGPPFAGWLQSLAQGANEVPKATDALSRLNDELKTKAGRLDELKEGERLTNEELVEYTNLLIDVPELERKAAQAKKDRVDAEAVAKILSPEVEAAGKQIVEDLQAGIGGQQDQLIKELETIALTSSTTLKDEQAKIWTLTKQYEERLSQINDPTHYAAIEKEMRAKIAAQHEAINKARADISTSASRDVADIMLSGSEEALKRVVEKVGPDSEFYKVLSSSLPEGIKKFDEENKKIDRENEARIAKRKEDAKEHAKEQRESNQQRSMEASANKEIGGVIGDLFKQATQGVKDLKEAVPKQKITDEETKKREGRKIIEEVEKEDFYTDYIDPKTGKAGTKSGVGLTKEQIAAAQASAREMQQSYTNAGGFMDDRTAAQLAIQEQVFKNQQQIADRFNQTNSRVNNIMQMGGSVPSIMEMGW